MARRSADSDSGVPVTSSTWNKMDCSRSGDEPARIASRTAAASAGCARRCWARKMTAEESASGRPRSRRARNPAMASTRLSAGPPCRPS